MTFGIVAIGRNEGARFKRCLTEMPKADAIIYVDSGSIDGSPEWAREQGVEVIDLDMTLPFTAARARNVGLRRLQEIVPDCRYVQLVDADCELNKSWPAEAMAFLDAHPDVAAVAGRLRERFPDRSTYNWLCDREWAVPAGESPFCGGIAIMRIKALEAVKGFRDNLIAGEEPELCLRLRSEGWRIWRLNIEMATHDAAITHFSQWWRRAVRAGYAQAQGAALHGKLPERHLVWEGRRAWFWGLGLPLFCLITGLLLGPWGWSFWTIYLFQALRLMMRSTGSLGERATIASFQILARFAEAWGHIKFLVDRLLRRRPRIIEYK